MNRSLPSSNKICSATWDKQKMQGHKQRLAEIKPVLNTGAPPVYPHLISRLKKEQMLEERYTQIEHENRVLLKKMSKILRTSSLDNLNVHFKPRSLNSQSRKKELKRIMDENQKILGAIQSRKAFYNRSDWETHAKNHTGYRSTIRERQIRTLPTMHDRTQSAPQQLLTDQSSSPNSRALNPIDKKGKSQRGKKKGKKAVKKPIQGDLEICKGGDTIDGKYVVLTVMEEVKPRHALVFQTFDVDTSMSAEFSLPFEAIEEVCTEDCLLAPESRKQLVDNLLGHFRFENGGEELVFNKEKGAEEPAATEPAGEQAAADAEEATEQPIS